MGRWALLHLVVLVQQLWSYTKPFTGVFHVMTWAAYSYSSNRRGSSLHAYKFSKLFLEVVSWEVVPDVHVYHRERHVLHGDPQLSCHQHLPTGGNKQDMFISALFLSLQHRNK